MPLYRGNAANMPQMAQSAMGSATQAMAGQQKQTTTVREEKTNFWDDLYKGARAVSAGASAASGIADAVGKGIDLYDKVKIRGAYDDIAKAYGQGGFQAIEQNPEMQDYWHAQALGQFARDRRNSRKGMLEAMQKSDAFWDKIYQDWRMQAAAVNKAYENGDKEGFMNGMEELVASTPIPYRIKRDENGNFRELFRSDEAGGWVETGRTITPEDALEQMKSVLKGERLALRGVDMKLVPENKLFNAAGFRSSLATSAGNEENRFNPAKHIMLYDRKGNLAGMGIKQNRWDDGREESYIEAYRMDGSKLGDFNGYPDLMKLGLSPYGPKSRGKNATYAGVTGSGGHGRRGGGHGRSGGGSGGAEEGGVPGEFRGSKEDMALFKDQASVTDDYGNKRLDPQLYNFFMNFQRQTGYRSEMITAAYDKNMKRIQAAYPKMDATEMQEMAMAAMWEAHKRKVNAEGQGNAAQGQNAQGAGQTGTGAQAEGGQEAGSQGKAAQGQDNPAKGRILEAVKKDVEKVAEKGGVKGKALKGDLARPMRGEILRGPAHSKQEKVLRGLQLLGESMNETLGQDPEDSDPYDW